MAKVINSIGALSTLKQELEERKITQFHSIKDIQQFDSTYDQKISDIREQVRNTLHLEMESLSAEINEINDANVFREAQIEEEAESQIAKVAERIDHLANKKRALFSSLTRYWLQRKIKFINSGRINRVSSAIRSGDKKKSKLEHQLAELTCGFDTALEKELNKHAHEIKYIKNTLQELRPHILGSIGENKVLKTLSSLPDDYVIINDVSVELYEPLYFREEDDRICSFQIDHVVIGPTGVFVIETKHWGKNSINNHELFSPVKQVKRNGYAIFRMLNSAIKDRTINLYSSWGNRSVSVHNILVLTASSTKQKFEHVKVLDPQSLNSYIQWFDEELTKRDVESFVSYFQCLIG